MAITREEVKTYLDEANEFFTNLHDYFEKRIKSIEIGAAGKSKYISQWLSIIARENIEMILVKLEKYETEKLDKSARPINQQKFYKEIISKTTEHVNRAKEFLENIVEDSSFTVQFIDVPAHRHIHQQANEKLIECNELVDKHTKLSDQTIPKARKSWLANVLREARAFVETRAATFGLPMKKPDLPVDSKAALQVVPEEQQESIKKAALARLQSICFTLNNLHKLELTSTKTTRQILGTKEVHDSPSEHSLHFEYCPANIDMIMAKFDKELKKLNDKDFKNLTHEDLIDLLEVESYPTPSRSKRAAR